MERYTIKDLRKAVELMNEFVIANYEYKFKVVPQYGCYYLYLQRREHNDGRVVRLLHAGTARECGTYLQGLRAAFWYFYNETDLPF